MYDHTSARGYAHTHTRVRTFVLIHVRKFQEEAWNSESDKESPPKRSATRRPAIAMPTKKKRRLTDLDIEEDEDDSDEDFLGTRYEKNPLTIEWI